MWMFLSSRLRTWVAFAVAIPVGRFFVHRFADSAQRRRPDARSTSALRRADSAVTALSQRRSRRRA
jgi:hypothetical protein